MAMAALAACSGAAAAEDEGAGHLVAFACGVLPAKTKVDVQMMDDTPREKAMRDAIAAQLRAGGYAVAADAPVRVTFEAEIERERDPARQGYLGKLDSTNRRTEFELNLWSSQGDSVLGGIQRPAGSAGPNVSHIIVSANDKANGKCLWRGEATHPMDGSDEVEAFRRIIPIVVRHMGQTVPLTAFSID
jgi:hypothetical protein